METQPLPGSCVAVVDGAFFSAIPVETRFYIVRHGQSEANARQVIQGKLDFPLDEVGRAQARAAGAWLSSRGVAKLLSSPLSRAAETARIIAAAIGLDGISCQDCLAELDAGVFSGLTLDEARARFPLDYAEFEHRSWEGVSRAERAEELFARAVAAWESLRAAAYDAPETPAGGSVADAARAIACVTHGGFIQWMVRATFGCRSWMPLVSTGNCGIFELLVAPTGGGRPAYLQWKNLNLQPASVTS